MGLPFRSRREGAGQVSDHLLLVPTGSLGFGGIDLKGVVTSDLETISGSRRSDSTIERASGSS